MDWLDNFNVNVVPLSEEHQLYRPDLSNSIAGLLPAFLQPLDNNLNFSDLQFNTTVSKRITEVLPSGYDTLIYIISDGLGAYHLKQLGGMLWDNVERYGTVTSSTFPTLTSIAMTSMSYGRLPAQHGIVGYNFYNEHIDTIWNALNLKYIDTKGQEQVILDHLNQNQFLEGKAMSEYLTTDISLSFLLPQLPSGLQDLFNPNVPETYITGYEDTGQKIWQLLNTHKKQAIFVYFPFTDHLGHIHGPESSEYAMAVRGLEQLIAKLQQHPSFQNGNTAIAVTADHGQSPIDHDISRWMDKRRVQYHKDQGITLSSSGRVLHAYCTDDKQEAGRELLEKLADGRGHVIDNKIASEMAGGDKFAHRMGDYLMIMDEGYLHDVPEVVPLESAERLFGQHGSLTMKELYVPTAIFSKQ